MEPLFVGTCWPHIVAVKAGFIKDRRPTAEELEEERQRNIAKKMHQRAKRKAPAVEMAKEKERQIRKRLGYDREM
jgi:hypothetical protein